jgi:hypothetical protein
MQIHHPAERDKSQMMSGENHQDVFKTKAAGIRQPL